MRIFAQKMSNNFGSLMVHHQRFHQWTLEYTGTEKQLELHINIVVNATELVELLRLVLIRNDALLINQLPKTQMFGEIDALQNFTITGYGHIGALLIRDGWVVECRRTYIWCNCYFFEGHFLAHIKTRRQSSMATMRTNLNRENGPNKT